MTAEGCKSSPLSDEMERRIRERLQEYLAFRATPFHPTVEGAVSALQWVLNEARAIIEDVPSSLLIHKDPCPDCGHEHLDEKRCNFPYAMDRECKCERKVRA